MLTRKFSSASHRSLTGNTQAACIAPARRHNAQVVESFPGARSLGRWNLPLAVTFETVTAITANGGSSDLREVIDVTLRVTLWTAHETRSRSDSSLFPTSSMKRDVRPFAVTVPTAERPSRVLVSVTINA
jgi:hypothetical protein